MDFPNHAPVKEARVDYHQNKTARRYGQADVRVLAHPDLTDADTRVYSILAAHRHHRRHTAWPGRETIAKMAGLVPQSVSRCTKRLVEAGALVIEKDGRGRGRSTTFSFPLIDGPKPQPAEEKSNRTATFSGPTPFKAKETNTTQQDPAPAVSPPPEISRDVRDKPSAPPPSPPEARDASFELRLDGIPPALIPAILCALRGLPSDVRQQLVDELVGAMQSGKVKHPPGYLRFLRKLFDAGTLIFEHAERIAKDRKRREANQRAVAQALLRRPTGKGLEPSRGSPEGERTLSPADIAERIAALRKALH